MDIYALLDAELLGTHMSFSRGCYNLDLYPSSIDPELLRVVQCDDCGLWEYPNRMIVTYDQSIVCNICIDNNP